MALGSHSEEFKSRLLAVQHIVKCQGSVELAECPFYHERDTLRWRRVNEVGFSQRVSVPLMICAVVKEDAMKHSSITFFRTPQVLS